MYDLICRRWSDTAGLTATIYAIRKRLNVLLVTKDLGGKTNFRPRASLGGRLPGDQEAWKL